MRKMMCKMRCKIVSMRKMMRKMMRKTMRKIILMSKMMRKMMRKIAVMRKMIWTSSCYEEEYLPSFPSISSEIGSHFGLRRWPKLRRKYFKTRISYHNGRGSPSFQLISDTTVRLMLSGDVNPNPGPVKNPCSVCKKAVAKHHCALPCAGCGFKCHIGKKCANITVKDYKQYTGCPRKFVPRLPEDHDKAAKGRHHILA